MRKFVCALAAAGLATAGLAATDAQAEDESYNFIFVHHAAPGHQFWEIEKNGMEEACVLINADCQMVFLQTQDGNIGEVLQNLEAAVEQQPDGIATTIMDPEAFDGTIQRAMDMGIPVVSYNVDDADELHDRYLEAVSGITVDVKDVSATWTTVMGWLESPEGGLRLVEVAPGESIDSVREKTACEVEIPGDIPEMALA